MANVIHTCIDCNHTWIHKGWSCPICDSLKVSVEWDESSDKDDGFGAVDEFEDEFESEDEFDDDFGSEGTFSDDGTGGFL